MDRIKTGSGAISTAGEVVAGVDLSGRRAVVTGGGSGIGVETARSLAWVGAAVVFAVRDTEAGDRAAAEIRAGVDGADVRVERLNLLDLASISGALQRRVSLGDRLRGAGHDAN